MLKLVNKALDLVEKHRTALLITTIVALVLIFLFMEDGYNWIISKFNKKEGFDGEPQNVLYMFYVDWCPHCTSAKPEIERLKKNMENESIENQKVEVRMVNAEKEEALASKFNVKGYPTIIFVKQGKKYTYEGERTADAIKAFMASHLK
jgi:thiol-disulfide isomerase/thioredoxin